MFELGTPLSVDGCGGPIIWPEDILIGTLVNHWFDGEDVSDLHESGGFVIGVMWDIWRGVEDFSDSVSGVASRDGESISFDVFTDNISDVFVHGTRLENLHRLLETTVRFFNKESAGLSYLADVVGLIKVDVESVLVDSNIQVYDITLLELTVVRNSVTDDLVD